MFFDVLTFCGGFMKYFLSMKPLLIHPVLLLPRSLLVNVKTTASQITFTFISTLILNWCHFPPLAKLLPLPLLLLLDLQAKEVCQLPSLSLPVERPQGLPEGRSRGVGEKEQKGVVGGAGGALEGHEGGEEREEDGLVSREGEGGSGQEDIWEGRGGKEGGRQGGEVGGGGHVEHFMLFI